MNKKEIYNFFNKYSLEEVERLIIVLDNYKGPDSEMLMNMALDIYDEKYRKEILLSEGGEDYNESDSFIRISILSDKELDFLSEIVDDVTSYLESIRSFEDEYRQVFEDFTADDYPIDEMYDFKEAINKEKEKRKNSSKKRVLNRFV